MTRHTKLGLLIGLVFIIGIGMVLSDAVRQGPSRHDAGLQAARRLVPLHGESSRPVQLAYNEPAPRRDAAPPAARRSADDRTSAIVRVEPGPVVMPDPAIEPAQPPAWSMVAGRAGTTAPLTRLPMPDAAGPVPPPLQLVNPVVGPVDVPALPAGWTQYTVEPGDNLGRISQKVYNTATKYQLIYQANRDKLPSENLVRCGMVLRIPRLTGSAGAAAPATLAPAAAPAPAARPAAPSRGRLLDNPMLVPVPSGHAPGSGVMMRSANVSTYTVQEGDTLSDVAAGRLGSARRWRELWEINRDRVPDPDCVPAGVVLRLPGESLARSN